MGDNTAMCSCKRSRDYDELKERYDKLEVIAKDMLGSIGACVATQIPFSQNFHSHFCRRLEELGVVVDE